MMNFKQACTVFRHYFLIYDNDTERLITKTASGAYKELRMLVPGEQLFSAKHGFAHVISKCPNPVLDDTFEMKFFFLSYIMSVQVRK